jgi:hypothetical protein
MRTDYSPCYPVQGSSGLMLVARTWLYACCRFGTLGKGEGDWVMTVMEGEYSYNWTTGW